MLRILLILCLLAGFAFAEGPVRVTPETDYPIIDLDSAFSLAKIKSECLPARESDPVARCKVKRFGDLGQVEGKNYFFVLYEWLDEQELKDITRTPPPFPRSNTAVLLFYSDQLAPNLLRPFYSDRDDLNTGWFEDPKIFRATNQVFLQIPHRSATTAEGEPDNLLIWQGQNWHMIDTQSWMEDLQTRLPDGCSVIGSGSINFLTMRASNMVWKNSDQKCCPTCGKIYADLELQEDRLVIKSVQYDVKARNK
jgi:hypothetical protein